MDNLSFGAEYLVEIEAETTFGGRIGVMTCTYIDGAVWCAGY